MNEDSMSKRDARARTTLQNAISSLRTEAGDLREQAAACEAAAKRIESAVRRERWWELERLLGGDVVESLCECSPADLLSHID